MTEETTMHPMAKAMARPLTDDAPGARSRPIRAGIAPR